MGDSRRRATLAVILLIAAVPLLAAITVTGLAPASGLTRGGELVHIRGTNLLGPALLCPSVFCAPFVKFGDAFATIVENTPAEIVAVAPPHAAGRVDVQVNVPASPPVTLASAYAYEDPAGDVRVLVPVVIDTAGAGGSSWRSELTVHNENGEELTFGGTTIAPFSSAAVKLPPDSGSAGAFVLMPRRLADNVSASLRVHDTTRDGDSWGVEVPIVPETQFRRSVILLSVPSDARYRTLLRVYGYAGHDTPLTVTFRNDTTGELLATRTLATHSGYAQLPIDVASPAPMRVQVSADLSLIWAFVSITNNATQQVTTITPTAATNATAAPTSLALGSWSDAGSGGNTCMTVTSTGASFDAGCWHGAFPLPSIGADGRFEADGKMYFGGPAPANIPDAHFTGIVQGSTLTFMAVSGKNTVGPFTLSLGDTTPCKLCL
jgi:hypothetical protein